jgi:hypothetical protein
MDLKVHAILVSGEGELRGWRPPDPRSFKCRIEVVFGFAKPEDASGADRFSILVATPAGLSSLASVNGIVASRGLLVVQEFAVDAITTWILATIEDCKADSWPETVDRLRRYFDWEHEGTLER